MILRNADWTIWRSLTKTRGPLCAVVQCINKKKRRAGAPFYVRYYPNVLQNSTSDGERAIFESD
jgi:hypothetical protein